MDREEIEMTLIEIEKVDSVEEVQSSEVPKEVEENLEEDSEVVQQEADLMKVLEDTTIDTIIMIFVAFDRHSKCLLKAFLMAFNRVPFKF